MSSTTFERSEVRRAGAEAGILAMLVAGLMGIQSALGLIFRAQYRDVEWIRETWYGNDWVTLLVAVPALVLASRIANRGSSRGHVLRLGLLAFAVYNYAFYLFGAALNVFFPLYVALCLLSSAALLRSIAAIDSKTTAATAPRGLTQIAGAYFLCVGGGLAAVWLAMWADVVLVGHAPPIQMEAFKIVAALDLMLMAPILIVSGGLLWLQRPHAYAFGAVAGIQALMYLTVLSVNSALAARSGRTDAAGELPVWGTLAVLTGVVVIVLVGKRPRVGRTGAPGSLSDQASTSTQSPQRA